MPLVLRAFLGLLIALVPAALVHIQLEREARHERTAQEADLARHFVRLLGRQLAGTVGGAQQTLAAMGAHAALRANVPSAECDAFLSGLVEASPRYVTANVFRPDGSALCTAQHLPAAANPAARPYFQRILEGSDFEVGEYARGLGTGKPSVHFAAPLRDAAGRLLSVLVVALSTDWLNAELARLSLPEGSAALVADRNGTILARSLEPDRFVGRPLPPFALALLHAPTEGVWDGPALDDVRRIAAYLPVDVPPRGFFVAVALDPKGAIDTALAGDRRASLLTVGSLLLVLLLGLGIFQRAVHRPMQRLLSAAARWREQDWGARVGEVGGPAEFRRLAGAFDAMAEAVQNREAARLAAASRMEAVVEVAPQLVLTADAQGQVDWVNGNWERVTGRDLAASLGEAWRGAIHPADRPGFEAAWQEAVAEAQRGGRPQFDCDLRLVTAEGETRWHTLRGAAQLDILGWPRGWMIVGLDIHALRAAREEAAALAADLRATYATAPVGLCLLDRDLRFIAVNETLARTNGAPPEAHIGRRLEEMTPHLPPEVPAAARSVLESGKPLDDFEVRGLVEGEQRVWLCNYRPVLAADGQVRAVSRAVIDITARKRIEESERLLAREVDHRAQNALAVVRGLVRLSAADAGDDVPGLVATLEGRIGALSRAHGVLAREKWVAADLDTLITQELGVHAERIRTEGPPIRLTAQAAQPLTLVLHELATNAVKHGALSTPEGRITLRWQAGEGGLRLEWLERGGPPVTAPPARRGFGSMLIDANVATPLAGRIERHWEAEGLRCVVTLGPAALMGRPQASAGAGPLHGRRVLMAHDDPATALALVEMLQASGSEVIGPATTWPEAMAQVEAVQRVDAAVVTPMLAGAALQPAVEFLQRRAGITVWLGPADLLSRDAAERVVVLDTARPGALREALIEAWSS